MRRPLSGIFQLLLGLSAASLGHSSLAAEEPTRRDPQPEVRYRLSEDSQPNDSVPKGRLEGPFLHRSEIIADTVRKYWVFVPAQYDESKKACLLVFQDGARAINPDGVLRVPQVLENLMAKQQIPVTIGIFITPGQRGDEFPDSIGIGNPNNRDREYDVLTDDYARMLIDEILPEVEKKYNLTKDPSGRAIGGASSGAICAFTVAWQRPNDFRNVISLIGSYTDIHGGHVYPSLVRTEDPKPIRVFIQDGEKDLRNPEEPKRDWFRQNQKMVAALEANNYDVAHVFGIGGHSDDHGGAMLPQILRWIWRDDPEIESPGLDLVAEATAIKPDIPVIFVGFDADAQVDPSGTYTWERRFAGSLYSNRLVIEKQGGKITGTLSVKQDDNEATESEILDPTMAGNKLIFDFKSEIMGREFTSTFQGIVGDDGIQGWRVIDFSGPRDAEWNATRVNQ